jgi:hypothetical protein
MRRGRDIMDKGLQSVRDLFDLACIDLSIDAEGEAELGAVLNDIAELRAILPTFARNAEAFNKALKAARDLQEVLPELFAQTVANAERPPSLIAVDRDEEALKNDYRVKSFQLASLSAALALAFPPDRQPVPVKLWLDDWHRHAHLLFMSFYRLTGHRSRTRKGAAAKFIAIALTRIGYPSVTPTAVELALSKAPRKWSNLRELILREPK